MKKLIRNLFFLPILVSLFLIGSCGSEVQEAAAKEESKSLALNEYGINASIDLAGSEVQVVDVDAKYEQKLLPNKKLEILTKKDFVVVISECQENGVEMKVEFAEGFGETVVEKGDDFCIIQQEDEDGNPVYDVSLFVEKEDAFIELKVCDPDTKAQLSSLEKAKEGLEAAKTFKFS